MCVSPLEVTISYQCIILLSHSDRTWGCGISTIYTHYLHSIYNIYTVSTLSSSFNRYTIFTFSTQSWVRAHLRAVQWLNGELQTSRHCEAEVKSLLYFHCDKLSQIDKMGLRPRAQLGLTQAGETASFYCEAQDRGGPSDRILWISEVWPSVLVTTHLIGFVCGL